MSRLTRLRISKRAFINRLQYSTQISTKYEIGQTLPCNWKVADVTRCPELNLPSVVRLEHEKCGAQWLHLSCPTDETNSFSVHFKTVPMDSTGVAHILEHVSLCGSQKYPVRDPFFKMLNRSLSTFMNAMTGPDYTLYPYATQNKQDFYNLMSVYLDAVFKPNLSENDFLQEGWRLDLANEADPDKLMLKGVVFNEMKGVFADPQQLFARMLMNEILPGHTYGICSGGLPEKIPDLTWENLKKFHASHYCPDNAKFYTYGDLPLEEHLVRAGAYMPVESQPKTSIPDVPNEPRWTAPRKKHIDCAVDPSNPSKKNATLAMSFLTSDIDDPYECFVLQVIGELLLDGPSAPFYKSLIETRLGSGFASTSGYESSTKDTSFTVGIQGMDLDSKEEVEETIKRTFVEVCDSGFEQDRIEAILHRTELALKNRSDNFGLNVIIGLTPGWNHVKNPFKLLAINENIRRFRESMASNPKYLQEKVKQYFVENQHYIVLTMAPKEGYLEESEKAVEAVEKRLIDQLSEEDRKEVIEAGKELLREQMEVTTPEMLACLPTLTIADIKKDCPRFALDHHQFKKSQGYISTQPTNGVSFIRAILDTKNIKGDRFYPLFLSLMTSMGAGNKYNFRQLETIIDLHTGGLGTSNLLSESPNSLVDFATDGLLISSHCLERNSQKMLDIWADIFTHVFENENEIKDRLIDLIHMGATDSMNGLAYGGHHYAITNAASKLGLPATKVRETHGGLASVRFINKLSLAINNGNIEVVDDILTKMKKMARSVLSQSNLQSLIIHATEEHKDIFTKQTEEFISRIPVAGEAFEGAKNEDLGTANKSYVSAPFPVHFCGKALPTVPYEHPDSAPLRILAKLLSAKHLHPKIREKGGAYGGGAASNPSTGVFSFYSYRDPNCQQTLEVFNESLDFINSPDSFTDKDIEEAKLGVFQAVDKPPLPGARGCRYFLTKITDDSFQEHRMRLKQVTREDLKRVAEEYLNNESAGICVIGPEASAQNLGNDWNIQTLLG